MSDRNIERLPADAALLRARRNDLRRYPSPERDGGRLYPLATPEPRPSFRILSTNTVFAIGSCFARNVERALEGARKRALPREFDPSPIGDSLEDGDNFFNKYLMQSAFDEIRWALKRDTFPGAAALYEVGRDRYVDPQLGMARLDFPMVEVLACRHRRLDAIAAVAEADVVI